MIIYDKVRVNIVKNIHNIHIIVFMITFKINTTEECVR